MLTTGVCGSRAGVRASKSATPESDPAAGGRCPLEQVSRQLVLGAEHLPGREHGECTRRGGGSTAPDEFSPALCEFPVMTRFCAANAWPVHVQAERLTCQQMCLRRTGGGRHTDRLAIARLAFAYRCRSAPLQRHTRQPTWAKNPEPATWIESQPGSQNRSIKTC